MLTLYPVIYLFVDRIGQRITGRHISQAPVIGPSEPDPASV